MITVLLVDDQSLIRRGLKALLRLETEVTIVAEADNGQAALDWLAAAATLPDVILMDIRMPILDGVAATRAITQQFPTVKVLILTTFDDTEYVSQALQQGAAGYLLKDTPPEELVQAIQLIHKGYTQLAPGLAQKLLTPQVESPISTPPVTTTEIESIEALTPREQEILHLIARGANNREISQQLYIAEKTVKNHITSILARLGLRDRTQAAIWLHRFSKLE